MSRTLVISDIHGCIDEFNELLEEVKYDKIEDQLILLGDYEDRGLKSKDVIEKVIELHKDGAIVLRGNHDQMFLWAISGKDDYTFLHNGGIHTIESYVGYNWFDDHQGFSFEQYLKAKEFIIKHFNHHIEFLRSLPCYYEDDSHIYVHAGLNPIYGDDEWQNQPTDDFLWIREMFIKNRTQVTKKVIFGHTPTLYMHEKPDIWFGEGKIGIDGGCCFGYQLNCLEIVDGGYRQYYVKKESLKT